MSLFDNDIEDDRERRRIVDWQPIHHHPRPQIISRGPTTFAAMALGLLSGAAVGAFMLSRRRKRRT